MTQSYLTTIFLALLNSIVFGQDLILEYSNFSDCVRTKSESNKILSASLESDTLNLKLELILNCSVSAKTKVDFKLNQDTLHLFIPETKTTTTITGESDTTVVETDFKMSESGETTTYSTVIIDSPTAETKNERALCDCTYLLILKFKNASQIPTIVANNILLTKNKWH
ncbi:MAG: hypothetical protein COA32_03045 [Fluviicola sp.]|nr:MAG: hypothetical protein COA32_03045 [Fluviicola sp.]